MQTLAGVPGYLSTFVGRSAELSTLRSMLAEPARLVTVVGVGGAGKTRIVSELAHQLDSDPAELFPDGVTWTDLAPVTDPDQVAPTTAVALGVTVGSDRDPLAALIRLVADRRLLLILDNCEQVAAACRHLVDAVLAACSQVAVLATSRTVLGVVGERVLALPPLSFANGDSGGEATELFYDRASRLLPGYPLLADDLLAVDQLCRRLDGLPLAIELAAPWMRTLSARDLLAEIDRSVDVLDSADPELLARHRSMRAVWDSTWRALTAEEQRVFSRLSVFHGGFTSEAAKAVVDASPAVLRALADRALIREAGDGGRYVLHDVVHQFAEESLLTEGSDAVEAVRQAHLEHFLELYERARETIDTPEEARWRTRQRVELPNADHALAWALDSGRADAALRMTAAVSTVWTALSGSGPRLADFEQALALPWDRESAASTVARAGVLSAAGFATMENGLPGAVRYFEEASSLYAAVGDEINHARGLSDCGFATRVEDPMAALGYLRHGLALCERIGDPLGIAWSRADLGECLFVAGLDEEAEPMLLDALPRFERLGVPYGVLIGSLVLGHAYRRQHRWRAAIEAYVGAVVKGRETMSDTHGSDVLVGLAVVAQAVGRPDCAARMFGAAYTWDERTGARSLLDPRRELDVDRAAAEARRSDPDWATQFSIGLRLTREQALEEALRDARELLGSISAPYPNELTARELEIARLVADGLSDADIAARLSISPRTVHTHLSAVYRKLNVKSRTAAVHELRRLTLIESP